MKKYIMVRDDLRAKILNKIFTDKLPSETQLTEMYGVGRSTIRRAIDLLTSEGYVISQQGKGVYVLEQVSFGFDLGGIESFREVNMRTGQDFKTEVIIFEKKLMGEADEKLTLFKADIVVRYIERIRKLNGERIIYDINYFRYDLVKDLSRGQAEKSIYEYIEVEKKMIIALSRRTIAIEKATKQDCLVLDMLGYDVVAVMHNHVYLEDGTLLEYTQSRHRPDKFVFTDVSRRKLHI
ncbi:GntR family transcriptional regulator [Erysipelotrichaceae bacterium]|nr:GntR family transcriptional regulator [Erysipelotrichaceae bacterium]